MHIIDLMITGLSYLKRKEKRTLIKMAADFRNKSGIEIGGPSDLFKLKGHIPVYLFAARVDGVNFSNSTLWEGQLNEGENYHYYKNKTGFQYIAEAAELDLLKDKQYDFVLSCHSLEHVANPLKAVMGWNKILKYGGAFVLVLPDKEQTFDNKRPYTSFTHILEDFKQKIAEDDTTHFQEVINLHDFSKDSFVQSKESLEKRTIDNFQNRAVHHHVFSLKLIQEMLEYAGFEIAYQQKANPHHLITIARKKA
jgi:ubiquinone/menaquinone biosynthesis C-methylase UbiE